MLHVSSWKSMQTSLTDQGVGKGGGEGFSSPRLLMYYVYRQLPQQDVQNLLRYRKTREKQLSGYKQCYTYKN